MGQLRAGDGEPRTCRRSSSWRRRCPYAGAQVWASDFLPGCHQGTRVVAGPEPIANLAPPGAVGPGAGAGAGPARSVQPPAPAGPADDPPLAARIRSFETAFGMQRAMPEVLDLSKETGRDAGALRPETRAAPQGFAWQSLVARRLAERGVRFVELIDTGSHQQLGLARRHARPRAAWPGTSTGRSPR